MLPASRRTSISSFFPSTSPPLFLPNLPSNSAAETGQIRQPRSLGIWALGHAAISAKHRYHQNERLVVAAPAALPSSTRKRPPIAAQVKYVCSLRQSFRHRLRPLCCPERGRLMQRRLLTPCLQCHLTVWLPRNERPTMRTMRCLCLPPAHPPSHPDNFRDHPKRSGREPI